MHIVWIAIQGRVRLSPQQKWTHPYVKQDLHYPRGRRPDFIFPGPPYTCNMRKWFMENNIYIASNPLWKYRIFLQYWTFFSRARIGNVMESIFLFRDADLCCVFSRAKFKAGKRMVFARISAVVIICSRWCNLIVSSVCFGG